MIKVSTFEGRLAAKQIERETCLRPIEKEYWAFVINELCDQLDERDANNKIVSDLYFGKDSSDRPTD